ncbi:MAG: S9 family peptidase [Phenylobacterium sp.]|uniref:alpha/beta hydrolase family protein n=1 Tax=Phenylobacterium sp. TaxID=1871053 RepID=UPI0012254764|nr:S9 family peptidase [Phenylobacterium sp.]TAL36032.1 MAG: S9 family peptidase [Phenylobacterium sp.]
MWIVARLGALVLILIAAPAAAAPLSSYGKLPSIEAATVSPSGSLLAVVTSDGVKRTIVVQDLAKGAVLLRGFVGAEKIRNVQWAGDLHLLVTTSKTDTSFVIQDGRREWFFGNVIDVAGKKIRPLMGASKQADLQAILGVPVVRVVGGKPFIFARGVIFSGPRGYVSLFRIDPVTGASRLIEQGGADTINWLVDADGEVMARELYNSGSGEWTLRIRSTSGWRDLASKTAPLDRPYLLGMGRTTTSVLYADRDGEDRWVWKEAPLDGGAVREISPSVDSQATVRARDGRLVGQVSLVGDEPRYVFHEAADAEAWKLVTDAFSGAVLGLQSWSNDRQKIVIYVDSPTDGPAYVLIDMANREVTRIGPEYAGIEARDIAFRTPVRFKASDGLPLSGYLTVPRDRAATRLPLIVFPHGGPEARDTPGFDWWAQGMASRGYAVLQVNYRGSAGLGRPHLEAGYGQWGRKMQTDLSDGVRHLVGQGTVDPKRVCIVGASYGGYAALAGATLDPGVYRCAVAVSGLSDLRRLAESEDPGARRYWKRFMGVTSLNDPALSQISPITHVDKVSIPILMIHGRDDTVVPLEQSEIMADALRKAGKPVELIVQKGEDHWLSRGETRGATLEATMAFVEKHNPPN